MITMDNYPVKLGDRVFSLIHEWGEISAISDYTVIITYETGNDVAYVENGALKYGPSRTIFWDEPEVIIPTRIKEAQVRYEYQWAYRVGANHYHLTPYFFETEEEVKTRYSECWGVNVTDLHPLKCSRREIEQKCTGLEMDGVVIEKGDKVYDLQLGVCYIHEIDYSEEKVRVISADGLRTRWRDVTGKNTFRLLYWGIPNFKAPAKPVKKIVYQWFFKMRPEGMLQLTSTKVETKEQVEEYLTALGYKNAIVIKPCEETMEVV